MDRLRFNAGLSVHGLFCLIIIGFCFGCSKGEDTTDKQLTVADTLLREDPVASYKILDKIDPSHFQKREKAYYGLLLTIAQHKNHIPFSNDSLIGESRKWYEKHGDYHNRARAFFYNGLVLHKLTTDEERACLYMREALEVMEEYKEARDDRLKALICFYLGQVNDRSAFNLDEAITYYQAAVDLEKSLENEKNLISNYSSLLVCLVKHGQTDKASTVLSDLDEALASFPKVRLEKTNNAKALYYLYSEKNLDSARFYALRWNPSREDLGPKNHLLAELCRAEGHIDSVVFYETHALVHRRETDTLLYHVHFGILADLYDQLGNADSTAHYAQLAYKALHDSFEQKTEKRILELEKQYDVASREAALERERRVRNVALLLLAFALMVAALLFWQWRLMRRNEALRQREALKDAVAKSIVNAVVATYSGINKRLAVIHNLPDKERQDALNSFIQENKTNVSRNLLAALETNYNDLPEDVRQVDALLDGAQQRTVFILTEMGFGPGEIGKMLGISSSQVRTVKTTVRDRIVSSDLARLRSIRQLQVMQVGTPVRKKE